MVGGIELGNATNGKDGGARILQHVAIILFLVVYVILCMLNVQSFVFRMNIMEAEIPIFSATSITLPILFPRLLFAFLALYNVDTKVFSSLSQGNTAVIVSAIFVTLPEFIIAAVILRAGFKVPSLAQTRAETNSITTKTLEA